MGEGDGDCKHGLKLGSCRVCKEPNRPIKRQVRDTHGMTSQGRKTQENSDTYFNHPWSEWNEMRDFGLTFLEEIAASRSTVSYVRFWSAVRKGVDRDIGSPWRQIPLLLRHIGEQSFDNSGLLVTALVVTEDRYPSPSEGFFRLAARLDLIGIEDSPETGVKWLGMTKPQRNFWLAEQARLYEYFAG